MKRRKVLVSLISLLTLSVMILIVMWAVNNIQNEKQLNQDLSERFDDAMVESYPLLEMTAWAFLVQTKAYEENAVLAMKNNPFYYEETFRQYNIEFWNTDDGIAVSQIFAIFNRYKVSNSYSVLLPGGGNLRKEESAAVLSILLTEGMFRDYREISIDEFIQRCERVKKRINQSIEHLRKYKTSVKDVYSWAYWDDFKYREIFQRYYKRKNWPFNF